MLARFKESRPCKFLHSAYNVLAVICVLYATFDIIKSFLISRNWIPGYVCEWHETKSISPFVNMFSGQEVRLDFDIYGDIQKKYIKSASWQLSNGSTILNANTLTPDFPLTENGIYEVRLAVTLDDGSSIKGKTNLNVIETPPKLIISNKPTTVPLVNTTAEQTINIQSGGVEFYSGNGKWQPVQSSIINGATALQFQPNQAIPTFDGQVLYRSQEMKNDLSGYGATHFPYKNE